VQVLAPGDLLPFLVAAHVVAGVFASIENGLSHDPNPRHCEAVQLQQSRDIGAR
jgi:hypothetical protein